MLLRLGSVGEEVRRLQEFLNLLPPSRVAALVPDGKFGPKTQVRVREFQIVNKLPVDGIAGPNTMAVILDLLNRLGILPGPTPPSPQSGVVRPILQQVLASGVPFPAGANNLIEQVIPPIAVMAEASYRPNVASNKPLFSSASGTVGRLGIFAAGKGGVERAVILLLPKTGRPDTTLICITQGFGQAAKDLEPLGWANPLSPPLIQFCLLKHVVNRWGAQVLASRKQMAFVYIVRAKGKELGPFANDGPFVKQVLTEMAGLTGDAFGFDSVEAMTFSSGIVDFNPFIASINGQLNLSALYVIDPAQALSASAPKGVARKQYLSGQTGSGSPGAFETIGLDRWQNEFRFPTRTTFRHPWPFNYLHNHCMPLYALHLALQTS